MGHAHLLSESDLALLHDWLQETGELYVDVDRPHSGGSNASVYLINDLSALKEVLSQETWLEVVITVFRKKLFPIRGKMDDALLASALAQIPDQHWFAIFAKPEAQTSAVERIGYGDCHDELRQESILLHGREVFIGQDPFDGDTSRFANAPDEVFVVGWLKHPKPHIVKNRGAYPAFDADPQRYRSVIEFW